MQKKILRNIIYIWGLLTLSPTQAVCQDTKPIQPIINVACGSSIQFQAKSELWINQTHTEDITSCLDGSVASAIASSSRYQSPFRNAQLAFKKAFKEAANQQRKFFSLCTGPGYYFAPELRKTAKEAFLYSTDQAGLSIVWMIGNDPRFIPIEFTCIEANNVDSSTKCKPHSSAIVSVELKNFSENVGGGGIKIWPEEDRLWTSSLVEIEASFSCE